MIKLIHSSQVIIPLQKFWKMKCMRKYGSKEQEISERILRTVKVDEAQLEPNQIRVWKQGSSSGNSKKNIRTNELLDVFEIIEEF